MSRRYGGRRRGYNFAFVSPSTAAKYDACYKYRWLMVGCGLLLILLGSFLMFGFTSSITKANEPSRDATLSTTQKSRTNLKRSLNFNPLSILFVIGFVVFLVCGIILCNIGFRVRAYRQYKEWQAIAQANGFNTLAHPYAMDNVFVTPMYSQGVAPQYPGVGYGGYPAPPHHGPLTHPGMMPGPYPGQGGGQPHSSNFNNGNDQGCPPQSNTAQLPGSIY